MADETPKKRTSRKKSEVAVGEQQGKKVPEQRRDIGENRGADENPNWWKNEGATPGEVH